MKKTPLLAVVLLCFTLGCFSQTIVKMDMPAQAKQALNVVTLFDETLPLNTTVVLGAVGYDITGGTSPYTLTWLKDNQVVATGDIAVIQPVSGSAYSLKVTDKNNCSTTTAINLNVSSKVKKDQSGANAITISPTIASDYILVNFSSNDAITATVRIFDMAGKVRFQQEIVSSTRLDINLSKGNYFVVVQRNANTFVEKIIVQ